MRCARATRRSAAVAAVAAAAPTTSLCLDGFTAIHRRDYYPVSPLRLLCTTTRPVHDTSRSIRLSFPFPLSLPSSAKPLSAPFLFRSLRYIVAEVGRDGRSRNNDNNEQADTRQRQCHILLGAAPNSTPKRTPTLIFPLREPNFRLQPRHYRDALSLEIRYYSSGRPRFNRASENLARVYRIGAGGGRSATLLSRPRSIHRP